MPALGRQHERAVLRSRVERPVGELHRVLEDALVERLAPRVQGLELARDARRVVRIVGEQQPQPVVRIADPARGIEPGSEDEPHVAGLERLPGQARRVEQRPHAGPVRVREQLQPVAHEDAVLPREGHHVRHRREGHEVEEMKRQVGRDPERRNEGLRQLERDARAAQVFVLRGTVGAQRVE
ncbi:MAG: hypothetical protein DMD65_00170, partial [Gemmatimonadetes bacterium]